MPEALACKLCASNITSISVQLVVLSGRMTKRADTRLWTAEEDEKLRVWQKELGNK